MLEHFIAIFAPIVFAGWFLYFALHLGERIENWRQRRTPRSIDANVNIVMMDADRLYVHDGDYGATNEAREALKGLTRGKTR